MLTAQFAQGDEPRGRERSDGHDEVADVEGPQYAGELAVADGTHGIALKVGSLRTRIVVYESHGAEPQLRSRQHLGERLAAAPVGAEDEGAAARELAPLVHVLEDPEREPRAGDQGEQEVEKQEQRRGRRWGTERECRAGAEHAAHHHGAAGTRGLGEPRFTVAPPVQPGELEPDERRGNYDSDHGPDGRAATRWSTRERAAQEERPSHRARIVEHV